MNNVNRKISVLFVMIFVLFFTGVGHVFATSNSGVPFVVSPILPSNQDDGIQDYISITSDEPLNQELQFLIENKQDKPQTIHIEPVNAYMSPNGMVEYLSDADKNKNSTIIDDSYEMKKYLTLKTDSTMTLEPNQRRVVVVELATDGLDGSLLGGMSFQTYIDSDTSDKSSMTIQNKLNQVIGVVVNHSTDKEVEFSFGDAYIDPMPSYYVVRLPITQHSPLLVTNATVDYQVEFQGEELFGSVKEIDSAPMTQANFAIPFESETIERNKPYTLKGTLTYMDTHGEKQSISFEKVFEFDGNGKPDGNGNAFEPPFVKGVSYWWLLLLLTLPIIAYVIRRNHVYVLQTDDDFVSIIKRGEPNFDRIVKLKDIDKDSQTRYVHYYSKVKVKTKDSNDATYFYKYYKTKTNKQNKRDVEVKDETKR